MHMCEMVHFRENHFHISQLKQHHAQGEVWAIYFNSLILFVFFPSITYFTKNSQTLSKSKVDFFFPDTDACQMCYISSVVYA